MVTFQNVYFLLQRRIIHRYFHQKAVELRFGKFIGSLLFHRILCSKNGIKLSHLMSNTVNADLTLFHHLEQGCLCFGRSTVDLVHQYDISKDRSLMKVKLIGFHIEHSGTQHVTRHQVRCELDTAEIRINQAGCQAGKQCLCHSRHSFYQHMTIGKDCRQYQIHRLFLTHNNGSNLIFQFLYLPGKES